MIKLFLLLFSETEEAVGKTRCFASVKIQVKSLQCAAVDFPPCRIYFENWPDSLRPPVSDLICRTSKVMEILPGDTRKTWWNYKDNVD